MFIAAAKAAQQDAEASRWAAPASSKTSYSRPCLPPEEVAAIFVEPVQGEGGYVVAPTVFMQELRRICDQSRNSSGRRRSPERRRAAPASGGRSSTPACSLTSSACAKGIASGMPLGITMSRAEHHGLGPRLARLDFRRQSRLHRRSAGDARCHRARRLAAITATEVGNHMMKRMADWPKKHEIWSAMFAAAA